MIFFCDYAAILAHYVDWIFYSLCFCVIPIDISKVTSDARFRGYRGCAEWLVDAGVVLNFPQTNCQKIPFVMNGICWQ